MKFKIKFGALLLVSFFLTACNLESEDNETNNNTLSVNQPEVIVETVKHGSNFTTQTTTDTGETIEIDLTDNHGKAIFEGDILVGYTKDILAHEKGTRSALEKGLRIPKTPANFGRFWTNAVVPYQFSTGYPQSNEHIFVDAASHISQRTPVTFVERTAANRHQYPNYIEIIVSDDPGACYSYLGMIGGRQEMGLGSSCPLGTTVHEIGHALGLWHEHTRSDRDNFVTINWDNIIERRKAQFAINRSAEAFGPYDYGSIMHYPTWGFAINRWQNTITPLQSGVTIGQRNALSAGDISVITDTYGDLIVEETKELENNVAVLGLAGNRGDETRMILRLPEGNIKNLSFQLTGGSGDADLYVKQGSTPSLSDYDCRPYIGGNHETCTFDTAFNGEYHVMIRAYSNYSGAQLTASYDVEEERIITPLRNGIPTNPVFQSNVGRSDLIFTIEVPAGMTTLEAAAVANGYRGFVQVRYGQEPERNIDDCHQSGVNPVCTVEFPQQGTWFILMRAFEPSDNASMMATLVKVDQSVLTNGSIRSNISIDNRGEVIRYTISVPTGSNKLYITTAGSNGDADLYIKRGSQPGTSNYDCRSYSGSSNEACNISNPSGGVYHIMVRAYQPFSGLTLRAMVE